MKRLPPATFVAAVLTLILALWYAALLAAPVQLLSARTNERVERTEKFGSDAISGSRLLQAPGHEIVLDGQSGRPASAEWRVDTFELKHVLAHANSCTLTFFATGLQSAGRPDLGSVVVKFDGSLVKAIHFSDRTRGLFPIAPGLAVPDGFDVRELRLAPLDNAYAATLPLGQRFCHSQTWDIRITAAHARWQIDRVGVIAAFVPIAAPLLGSVAIDTAAATFEILIILAGAFLLLRTIYAQFGTMCLIASVGALALSPVTHDQWDFAVWLRFIDLLAFGHANPAGMWFGTPLWAFIPALLAPCLTASYAIFGNGSPDLVAVLLKVVMGIAYVATPVLVASLAAARFRRATFLVVLLSPIGLYQLAGGYREVFAGALLAAGIRVAFERRLVFATVLLCAAASITESLLPFILFAPALALAEQSTSRYGYLRAVALAALAVGIVCGEWLLLIPHDIARSGLASRLDSYRFGGASWYGALDDLALMPAFLRTESFIVSLAILVGLAVSPVANAIRCLRANRDLVSTRIELLKIFALLTTAFFLSFRGVDPNTWYALFIAVTIYFAQSQPASPFPILLGTVQGLTLYAILGLGDFVNWTYLWPHDHGLFGILGRPMDVFTLVATGLILAFYIAVASGRANLLLGPSTPIYFALFLSASANAAIRAYPEDSVFCCATAFLVFTAFVRLHRLSRKSISDGANPYLNGIGLVSFIIFGGLLGSVAGTVTLAASLGIIFTIVGGLGMTDIVLTLGSIGIEAVEPGFGWFSIVGWIALSLIALRAIYVASRAVSLVRHVRHGRAA